MKNVKRSGSAPARAARCGLQLAIGAWVCLGAATLSGCSGSDAQAQARKGSQSTPWGAPYSNMPDIVPPNVRPDSYAPLTAEQAGPALDPAKGYRVDNLGGGVYMVGDNGYNTMFVVSDAGVILADAPPLLGAKILKAIQDVAPGVQIVKLIYSHAHLDHIGYAGEIVKTNPGMQIIAHEETRKALVQANDASRPVPTQTFNTQDVDFPVVVGNQILQLRYPGPNHDSGNIGIYHPGQKVLMLVDVIYPGWMMWRRLGLATNIPGYFNLVKDMKTRWDFDKLVAGHFQVGTRADVDAQLEFMTDMHNALTEAMGTLPFADGNLNPANANNTWAAARDWIDRVTNHCVNKVTPKWSSRLGGYDVWIYEQCMALEQSIRIDGPSLR
ncbi:MAG TPA: MBL fold metallo-hydrolase [Ramlibacter sp.]|nr:MBL fold metallo-hydrolase [Ramlibacter sp.]